MKRNWIALLTLGFLAVVSLSCNNNSSSYATMYEDTVSEYKPEAVEESFDNEKIDKNAERKLIKEGSIRFETSDINKTRANVNQVVKNLNAYISQENSYQHDSPTYSMIIRVPAENFDALLENIASNARKVDSKNITVQDVTAEYIDYEARVKTKKELEVRYKELLAKAGRVEEILEIEREAANLRADIESIEGQLKYLKDRVSYSTLSIEFYEKGKQKFGFAYKFTDGLKSGWTNLLYFFIFLVNLWPFFILIPLVVFGVRKWRRRKSKRK